MISTRLGLVGLGLLLLLSGCGGGSDSGGGDSWTLPNAPTSAATTTIRLENTLAREVPSEVTRFRLTGFDAAGGVRYGPNTQPKSAVVDFVLVPTSTVRVQVEYLQGERVIGLALRDVVLRADEILVLVNLDFTDVEAQLDRLSIEPSSLTIPLGLGGQLTALGHYDDGSVLDLSGSVHWATSSDSAVEVDERGRVETLGAGRSVVTAALGSRTATATVTVSQATVQTLSLAPSSSGLRLPIAVRQQLIAQATYSDGTIVEVGDLGIWTSSNPEIVSVDADGSAKGLGFGSAEVSLSFSGLVISTTVDVYNQVELVSLRGNGTQVPTDPLTPFSISADGNSVSWGSRERDVDPLNTSSYPHTYVRDRRAGTTSIVTPVDMNSELDGTGRARLSGDGQFITFQTSYKLLPEDTNRNADQYLKNLQTGEIRLLAYNGGFGSTLFAEPSHDGSKILCNTSARLDPLDTDQYYDAYFLDLSTGQTEWLTSSPVGTKNDGVSNVLMTPDGRYCAFKTAQRYLAEDGNSLDDWYLKDRQSGALRLISLGQSGGQALRGANYSGSLSDDGRFFTYIGGDLGYHVLLVDLATNSVRQIAGSGSVSYFTSISGDGSKVAFTSSQLLVPDDTSIDDDIYLYETESESIRMINRASVGNAGAQGQALGVVLSNDGCWAAFLSTEANLSPTGQLDGYGAFVVRI